MSSNDPGPSKKRDADIQTQIICGVEKEAPESPTKDIETQTQFTYDPKLTNSEILAEIQTQDPVHSVDNIEVVEPEAEGDEAQEEKPEGGEDETQYQTADEGDEENHDFMMDEVDDVDGDDAALANEQKIAEIEVQTSIVLGVGSADSVPHLKCLSAGMQTVFTYDLEHSMTKIQTELKFNHPQHGSISNEVDDSLPAEEEISEDGPVSEKVSEPVETEEAAPSDETSPVDEADLEAPPPEDEPTENIPAENDEKSPDDEEDEVLNGQRTAELEVQTSMMLGIDSTGVLPTKCHSMGIQTFFSYDITESNIIVDHELKHIYPRHSTDMEEPQPLAFKKSMDIQTIFTYDINNSDTSIQRELKYKHPQHDAINSDAVEAASTNADSVKDIPADESDPTEAILDGEDAEVTVPVGEEAALDDGDNTEGAPTDEEPSEDILIDVDKTPPKVESNEGAVELPTVYQKTAEIEVQTAMMLGVDSTGELPVKCQSMCIQTVFTYDIDQSDTYVDKELRNARPRHSNGEETVKAPPSPRSKSMDIQTVFTYDIRHSDTRIERELKKEHPRHDQNMPPPDEEILEPDVIPDEDGADDEMGNPAEEDNVVGTLDETDIAETDVSELITDETVQDEAVPDEVDAADVALGEIDSAEDAPDHEDTVEIPESGMDEDIPKSAEVETQTAMILGVDSTDEFPMRSRTVGIQTNLTYELNHYDDDDDELPEVDGTQTPRCKSMDIQTVFTYDEKNSDTKIERELKKKYPRHSTDEQPPDESVEPDEIPDVAPEGSVSSGEGELEFRSFDATHSKASNWLPEPTNNDLSVDDEAKPNDEEEIVAEENVQESQIPAREGSTQSPARGASFHSPVQTNSPVQSGSNGVVATTDLPKTIKLKLQIVVGEDKEPMNMDIAIVMRPLRKETAPAGAHPMIEDTLMGVPIENVKQVVSTVIDAVIHELPNGTEMVSNKRDVEAQTNMALGRDSVDNEEQDDDNDIKIADTLPTPPSEEPELEDEEAELLKFASTERFEMLPMLETDLLVTQETLPQQYRSTLVPLSDDNCSSMENLAEKKKNRNFSDKLLIDETGRKSSLDPKKSPKKLNIQNVDYEHWGFPFALDTRYQSQMSTISGESAYPIHHEDGHSHLDKLDGDSSIAIPSYNEGVPGVDASQDSGPTRVIFQIQSTAGESVSFDGRESNVKNQIAFQMKIPADDESKGEKNQVRFILQYGQYKDLIDDEHPGSPPEQDGTEVNAINVDNAFDEDAQSVHIATVELKESGSGEIKPHVHYNEGDESRSTPLIHGEGPLQISVPVTRRDRLPRSISEVDDSTKPTSVHKMRIVVQQEGEILNRESITLLEGGAPITINIPVGDGGMGIAVTANIINEGIDYSLTPMIGDERETSLSIIPPKPIRCTVITNGVPGETFEQIMEPSADPGEPMVFFLPMAEGPVRARLFMVPRSTTNLEPVVKRPRSGRASILPKGPEVSCQVVHSGVPGEELTKSLQPGGLALHFDIPLNLGLSAKIQIPPDIHFDGERQSDGDFCRDRAFETVADALATYEQGIQPLLNLLDDICGKVKALNVPEMAGLGEPPDQPYLDEVDSENFSDCNCMMLVQRGSGRHQSHQRGHSPRHSRNLDFPQCNCGSNSSSPRSSTSPSSPNYQCCYELTDRYSTRSNSSPHGYRRSSRNDDGEYSQCHSFDIQGHSGSGSPIRNRSCILEHSDSKECERCCRACNQQNGLHGSKGSPMDHNVTFALSARSGCEEFFDELGLACRRGRSGLPPRNGSGLSMRRNNNTDPHPYGDPIKGRCQKCGSSLVEILAPLPPPPSCGCDAIVPFQTAVQPFQEPVSPPVNNYRRYSSDGCNCEH